MGYTFISYSRKQLYFAESIVLKLQQAGFEIWFDLQKLEPGVHWANALAEGYGNCERLVFIASKAAVQSPYVQVEWETALQNGHEVIVVLTEPVTLPQSLRNYAVYDASTRFDPTLQDLIGYLRGERPARHDPVPTPGRSVFLNKMPLDIWLTVGVMLMPALTVWIATFGLSLTSVPISVDVGTDKYLPGSGPYLVGIIYGLILALLQFPIRSFLEHTTSYEELEKLRSKLLWTQFSAAILCYALTVGYPKTHAHPIGYLIFIFPLVTIYWSFWTLKRSPDLLRWLPSGEVDQEVREHIQGELLPEVKQSASKVEQSQRKPFSFALHYHPADRAVAGFVQAILQFRRCILTTEAEAAVQLIIVSNRTSKQWLSERNAALRGKIIHILATNINTPPDLQPVLQTQWVDFRNGRKKVIQLLADQLSQDEGANIDYGMQISPTGFDNGHGFPLQVRFIFGVFVLLFILALIPIFEAFKLANWMFFPVALPFILYLDGLIMRKISLPSIFQKFLKYNVAWFASPAPKALDPIGNNDRKYVTDRNFLMLVDSIRE
jgi:TIR domain-containing protein